MKISKTLNGLAVLIAMLGTFLVDETMSIRFYSSSNIQFNNHITVVEPDVYDFYWNYDEISTTIKVRVKGAKWVGFGLSPNGGMKHSDVVVFYLNDDGTANFTDRSIHDSYSTSIDKYQDWTLLEMGYVDDYLEAVFKRNLQLCTNNRADTNEIDYNIDVGTVRFIYAWGSELRDNDITRHSNRGSFSLAFLNSFNQPVDLNMDEIETFDFRVNASFNNVSKTTYFCQLFQIPSDWLTTKRHLLRAESLVTPGNEKYVHHWLLYECSSTFETIYLNSTNGVEPQPDTCFPTDSYQPPNDWMRATQHCNQVALAWAIGSQLIFDFPKDIAYPIGGPESSSKYFYIQMHYDNPTLDPNVHDNSGVRLYVTKNYRPIESGILMVGASSEPKGIIVPPQIDSFGIDYFCRQQALNDLFETDDSEVTIFANIPHTHLTGSQVLLKKVRDNREIEYITKNLNYDFNYQFIEFLLNPIKLRKGDELKTTCVYKTKDRNDFTLGGPTTYDEMCLNFIFYYPRNTNLTSCLELVSNNDFYNLLFYLNQTQRIQISENGLYSYSESYRALKLANHTNTSVEVIKYLYETARRTQYYSSIEKFNMFTMPKHFVVPIDDRNLICDDILSSSLSKYQMLRSWIILSSITLLTYIMAIFKQ